jgi:hypothetical protein
LVSATANQLKSTQQLANAPSQSFNNHHQEIAHLPCATPKTNPVNESLKSNPAQTADIINPVATSSIPRQGLHPILMHLDDQPAQLQATEMDLDINLQQVPITCNRMDLEIPSMTNEVPRLMLRFSHPSKMADTMTKNARRTSAKSA